MSGALSGACLEQHLGHIANNGQQSAVLQFWKSSPFKQEDACMQHSNVETQQKDLKKGYHQVGKENEVNEHC